MLVGICMALSYAFGMFMQYTIERAYENQMIQQQLNDREALVTRLRQRSTWID